ncbi:MAG: hypothetical protein JRG91_09050 [Deltaproteobacteria bacterium]|nr:hypothetical protein [Deltaproteobacteria bacterium]
MKESWIPRTLVPALTIALLLGCGAGDGPGIDGHSDTGGDASDTTGDAEDTAGDPVSDCPRPLCGGECCADDERCVEDACCQEDDVCGSGLTAECCASDEVCEAGGCHLDCGDDTRCGDPEVCCTWPEVCYIGECVAVGDPCSGDGDCPEGYYCEPTLGRCMPRADPGDVECEYMPDVGDFYPTLEWSWTTGTIEPSCDESIAMPVVANLTDDNSDTVVDENDIPDIIFTTMCAGNWTWNGILRAISGDGSGELWSLNDPADAVMASSSLAVGDIDGDGLNEIVACSSATGFREQVVVFENDGTRKWVSDDTRVKCRRGAPFIANMDKTGDPEIVIRYTMLNSSGTVVWSHRDGITCEGVDYCPDGFTTAADLDLDGYLEVVGGNLAVNWDGSILWERSGLLDGYPAVANLDGDTGEWADAEVVVVVSRGHSPRQYWIRALHSDGSDFWGPIDINGGSAPEGPWGGGPPTIADFDGDNRPEIGLAGGYGYVVFNGEDGSELWWQPTVDLSSRTTGSSVFDFEGDGKAEVVYNDEEAVRIYDGTDGTVLWETCNTSGTAWEYPLTVDVDRDDHAEIIVVANNYYISECADGTAAKHGVYVFGDATDNWVRTLPIWNQHTYHVTNVNVDGSIPVDEELNWQAEGLNNFRQNVQVSGLHAAPDLVPRDLGVDTAACPDVITLFGRIYNQGSAGTFPGVDVSFYEGDPTGVYSLVAVLNTTRRLLPGESELLEVDWTIPGDRREDGEIFSFFMVVDDDGTGTGHVNECNEDNNQSAPLLTECPGVI